MELIRPLNLEELRATFAGAQPFPHVVIENFLNPQFCAEVAASFPDYSGAQALGHEFDALNEKRKIQITDSASFPTPVSQLNECLASQEFLHALGQMTGISGLVADEQLMGGGMHLTGPGGRLDVHVDFNYVESRNFHRRLNILVYFNDSWADGWGGQLELWNQDVSECQRVVEPVMNRCVIFETSEISYHGVRPISRAAEYSRKSFAAYYYTYEPPAGWDGSRHSTVFRSRPKEKVRGYAVMPVARALHAINRSLRQAGRRVKRLLRQ